MSVISFSRVHFSFTSSPLIADLSFTCSAGERLCVVGPNGAGKSTVLRLAVGELTPDSGSVCFPDDPASRSPQTPRSHAPAEAPGSPAEAHRLKPDPGFAGTSSLATVGDVLDGACAGLKAIEAHFVQLTERLAAGHDVSAEYDRVMACMDAFDVWALGAHTASVLTGLGLQTIEPSRTVASLSGGQRSRLALAGALLARPPSLVLDEPTNHLDPPARGFLRDLMIGWSGPVLFTSHDRAFIDDVATGILDLDTAPWQAALSASGSDEVLGAYRVSGNYTDYLADKAAARRAHRDVHTAQQRRKRALMRHREVSRHVGHKDATPRSEVRMARKFYADRAQRVSARRVDEDTRRLEALAEREVRKPREDGCSIALTPVGPRGGIAVSVREAAVPGRLAPTSVELAAGEHLLVIGGNGSGKSTLLSWMASGRPPTVAAGDVQSSPASSGRSEPLPPVEGREPMSASGSIVVAGRIGYVPQSLPEPDQPGATAALWRVGVGEAGKGLLHPRHWSRPIGELSEGNRRRVQFALAIAADPEVLIVDEPTNYLDLDFVDALEAALSRWDGTLVVATHDRWLIDHWVGAKLLL